MSTRNEFAFVCKEFTDLTKDNPPINKVQGDLQDMIDAAKNSAEMNYRQKEAIIARCENYLNGTYGKKDQDFKAHKQS